MKKSISVDKQCVTKILSYIKNIKQVLEMENVKSSESLEDSIAAKYAVTQLVTNIYELSKNIQASTLSTLQDFSKIRLRTTRQIASHDYASIDFKLVYAICVRLMAQPVYNELSKFIKEDVNDGEDK